MLKANSIVSSLLILMIASFSDPVFTAGETVSNSSANFMRGMISVTPQGDPASYGDEIDMLMGIGLNTITTFHGSPSNNDIFLELADEAGIGCIPSIPLVCWIRFGDPPYAPSGPMGWPNILEWLKLYGYSWPELPQPFSRGPNSTEPLTDDELESQVREILEGYGDPSKHPSLLAYYAFDEPSSNVPGAMDRIARVHSAFFRLGSGGGGRTPPITGIFLWNEDGQAAAREYLVKTSDPADSKPPVLMYDCYVLSHATGSDLREYESYANRWVEIGREFGVPVIAVPQGFAVRQRPAANELRAQAYLALAAGCKGINWFRLETLRAMGGDSLGEIAHINRDLEIVGPVLMDLERAEGAASMSGCGGRYASGTVNTFREREGGIRYLFLASKDVVNAGIAKVTVDEAKVEYSVDAILDCHDGSQVDFAREGGSLIFDCMLEPGQGRLLKLVGDPTIPVGEAGASLPLLLLLAVAVGRESDRE